jgi:EmrB/QacA subfamily drug resistance transporter
LKQVEAQNNKVLILLVIGFGSFLTGIDSAVINLILPLVRREFWTSVAAVQWISLAFLLTVSGLLLPCGRVGDLFGLRRVYLAGVIVFLLAAFLCAVAPGVSYLMGFRVLQAAGSAMIQSVAPALLTLQFPEGRRGRVLGLQLTMTYLGLTVGPFLGGFVAEWWSWRGVFWLYLPITALLLLLSFLLLPEAGSRRKDGRFDVSGAGLLLGAVVIGMLGITGFELGGIGNPLKAVLRAGLIVLALLLGLAFVRHEKALERAQARPIISFSLFARRSFSLSAALSVIGYTCEFFVSFLMPFYLLQVLGFSPLQVGLLFMAKSMVMIATAPLAGDLSDRKGPRPLSVASMLCFASALWLQSQLSEKAGVVDVLAVLGVTGLAGGLFVAPNNSAMVGVARREMKGMASAILALVRNFGMVSGTALSGALLSLRPENILAGFHLAMGVGALIALGGLGVALLQTPEPVGETA